MSENRNNWSTLGSVVLGVGAAAAAGYLLYELLNEDETPQPPQPSHTLLRAIESHNNCPLCRRWLDKDEFKLECGHKFHWMCLLSNYIVHMNDTSTFCCPVENCKVPIRQMYIEALQKYM